ncbi:MAG: hypothetical protein HWN67_04810 [Candidatus Helarchaeota archaeon]|nr:hypothetical protein [Candidatus Helarchaeota archaeon]
MSFLDKLDDWPSPEKTKLLLIISIILTVVIYIIMAIFLMQSGGMANQLSFSGPTMKSEYFHIIILNNGMVPYSTMQILDYVFMVGYGSLIFSLALIIGRKFDAGSRWRLSGYIFAILGIFAGIFDGFENAFILLTLTNPLFFPDWWTFAHSCFAVPKYSIIIGSIVWAIIASLINKFSSS